MTKIINASNNGFDAKPVTAVKQPHKHAAIIKAWADGASVQWKGGALTQDRWVDNTTPYFCNDYEYRIKPEKKSDGQLMFECFSNQCEWENLNSKLFWEHAAVKFLASKAKQT